MLKQKKIKYISYLRNVIVVYLDSGIKQCFIQHLHPLTSPALIFGFLRWNNVWNWIFITPDWTQMCLWKEHAPSFVADFHGLTGRPKLTVTCESESWKQKVMEKPKYVLNMGYTLSSYWVSYIHELKCHMKNSAILKIWHRKKQNHV